MSLNMFSDTHGQDIFERKRIPSAPKKSSDAFLPQLVAPKAQSKPSGYVLFDSAVPGNNLNLNSVNRMLDTKSSMNFMLKRQEGVLHRQEKELKELRASLKKPGKTPLWLSEDRLDSDSLADSEQRRYEESEDEHRHRHHHHQHHKTRDRYNSSRRHQRDRDFERQEDSSSEDDHRVQERRHRHRSVDRRG